MHFKRDIFTGELVEVPSNGKKREIIARIDPPFKPCKRTGNFRLKLSALGVGPDEVPAAMEHDRQHGVPTEYDADGDPIITSMRHMEAYDRINGFQSETALAGQQAYDELA